MQSTTTRRAPLLSRSNNQPTAISRPESPSPIVPASASHRGPPPTASPQNREIPASWRDSSHIRAPPSSPQELEAGHGNPRLHTPFGGYWSWAGDVQPIYLDGLDKRQEEERKVEEVQRMVEKRLQELFEKNKDSRVSSDRDIAAGEGSLAGVGGLRKSLPVPTGKTDWARVWQIPGTTLAGCEEFGRPCVEGGDGAGFYSAPIAGLTQEKVDEANSWHVKADKVVESNAIRWSGGIPNVLVAHRDDRARGGEETQSLEASMIADVLRRVNTAEYGLERARKRIQELEEALTDMKKEVAKCREEELDLAQRVSEIESRNRLMGEILGGYATRSLKEGFERRGGWGGSAISDMC
ncbi:uncharacterized protein LAJ45_08242 [Morchella importuna]|uniref:uncharacterized protein n=1 Tax=Morchella importuna TaxID=1174673 RepID=UPI001E8CA67E|nr:uncharacterized protein LAJ45_08242 [Morchella importuna]KAH8147776.1 hypothetical protein LAJ45_08242 [Morchella importuna]